MIQAVIRVTRKPPVTRVTRKGANAVTRQPTSGLQADSLKNNSLAKSPLNRVTRVTRKTTADLKGNPFKNNVVTRVTRKNACGLQENLNKNNVVTRVTHVTRKNNNVRNNINAEQEAFEERAAIAEAPPRAAHVAAFLCLLGCVKTYNI